MHFALASTASDMFARGYINPQMQVQLHHFLRLNNEVATQKVWTLSSATGISNVFDQVHLLNTWITGTVWSYSLPIKIGNIKIIDLNKLRLFVQCMECSGTQVLSKLPSNEWQNAGRILVSLNSKTSKMKFNTMDVKFEGQQRSSTPMPRKSTPGAVNNTLQLQQWMSTWKISNSRAATLLQFALIVERLSTSLWSTRGHQQRVELREHPDHYNRAVAATALSGQNSAYQWPTPVVCNRCIKINKPSSTGTEARQQHA